MKQQVAWPARRPRRRGAVLVLVSLLSVFLVGMVALAVDMSYILVKREQMHNAADAAALAAASQLLRPQFAGDVATTTEINAAIATAKSEAQRIAALNGLNVLSGDIVVGRLANPADPSEALVPWSAGQAYPNAVQVGVRRDASANSPLSLFFARVLGVNQWSGQVSATASAARGSTVTGFNSSSAYNLLLPIAIDAGYWNTFLSTGRSPDGQVHDGFAAVRPSSSESPPNNVDSSADGVPEFNDTYPNNNSPGNFGLVSIGPPSNSTPAFRDWIDNGGSPSDMRYFGANGLQATANAPAALKGGPGLKSTLSSNLANQIGKPRILLLFSSYSGNGSNTTYNVTGFAGVTIVSVTGQGNNMQVVVQPTVVVDPTATVSDTSWNATNQWIYPSSPLALIR